MGVKLAKFGASKVIWLIQKKRITSCEVVCYFWKFNTLVTSNRIQPFHVFKISDATIKTEREKRKRGKERKACTCLTKIHRYVGLTSRETTTSMLRVICSWSNYGWLPHSVSRKGCFSTSTPPPRAPRLPLIAYSFPCIFWACHGAEPPETYNTIHHPRHTSCNKRVNRCIRWLLYFNEVVQY